MDTPRRTGPLIRKRRTGGHCGTGDSTIGNGALRLRHRARGGGEHGRDHGRVVRLLPLRRGRRGGVPGGVLPDRGSHGGHAGLTGDLRDRVHRAAGWRAGVRPLRRPDRPQEAAGAQPAADGRLDLRDRAAARLRDDRGGGAAAAGPAAADPGLRAGRRMGRGGPDRLRARRSGAPRVLGELAAGRRPGGTAAGERAALPAVLRAERGGLRLLGMAHPVPALRGAGADRAVRAARRRGVSRVPRGAGQGRGAGCRRGEGDAPDPRGVPPVPA